MEQNDEIKEYILTKKAEIERVETEQAELKKSFV